MNLITPGKWPLQAPISASPYLGTPQVPGYADWDFAALKNFGVTESKQLQFHAELCDVLNRTNFRLPDSDISSPTFNHILAAEAPRQIQFALKFTY